MAVELLVRPDYLRLVPVTAGDEELIGTLSQKTFLAKLTRISPRSVLQNNFYWKVLAEVIEHQDVYKNPIELHIALKVRLGYIEEIHLIGGRMMTVVKSTSFDRMDAEDFRKYMDSALAVLCEEVIPGTHRSSLLRRVEETSGISYNALWQGAKAA